MYRSSDAPPSKRHKAYLIEDTTSGEERSEESRSQHKDHWTYEADVEKHDEKAGDEDDGRSVAESMEGAEGDDEFALLVSVLNRKKKALELFR